jgi:hypothetical protein
MGSRRKDGMQVLATCNREGSGGDSLSTSEAVVKAAVQTWLEKAGFFWLRIQSGKVRVKRGFMQLCPKGTADIVVFHEGKTFWIEMKTAEGKQRPEQKEFQEKAIAAGHGYLLARTLDDVRGLLEGEIA